MKKVVLFLACGLFIGNSLFAQKLGFINTEELLSLMPEFKKADTTLANYGKSFQDQLEAMQKEYQKKGQEFSAQEKTMTEAMREVKMKELQDIEQRYLSTQQSAQDKVAKKREELLTPIVDKAKKAIQDVAKANNFDYVFEEATLIYKKESDDLLPLVKTKLGIK